MRTNRWFKNVMCAAAILSAGQAAVAAVSAGIAGNNIIIHDGTATTNIWDGTDMGKVLVNGFQAVGASTFEIRNFGLGAFNLTGEITITGAHAADFEITGNPDTELKLGQATKFDVIFDPSAAGNRFATIVVPLNNENYTFAVKGEGLSGGITLAQPDLRVTIGPKSSMRRIAPDPNNPVYKYKGTLEVWNEGQAFDAGPGKVEVWLATGNYLDPQTDPKVTEFNFTSLPPVVDGKIKKQKFKLKLSPEYGAGTYFIRVIPDSNQDSYWPSNEQQVRFSYM